MKSLIYHIVKGNIAVNYQKHNGLYNSCLYPSSINKVLFKTAWLSFVTGAFALYQQKYDIAIVPFSVWISSILYWHNPIYKSWRRTLDVTVVRSALIYQLWKAKNAENRNLYYATVGVACAFYPISDFFYNKELIWLSAFSHSFVHILGNISNFILYSGHL